MGVAIVAVLALGATLSGGRQRSTPAVSATGARIGSGSSAGASRREVASTALTGTQIYQRDSAGVVAIRAVTAGATTAARVSCSTDRADPDQRSRGRGRNQHRGRPGRLLERDAHGDARGRGSQQDLALIRIDPSGLNLKPLSLVSSSSVQVGDSVYAIGNPYGLDETLTRGIVSALNREIAAPDGAKITGAIQTDAALNPGNSGGPLLNEQGDVVGVNSQIASDATRAEGSQPGSTGVGFAIASNTVAQAVNKIEAGEGVSSSGQSERDRPRRSRLRRPGIGQPGQRGRSGSDPPLTGGPRGPGACWEASARALYTAEPREGRSGAQRSRAPPPIAVRPCRVDRLGLVPRAISSAGRAPPRQGGGHWFEPSIAHSRSGCKSLGSALGDGLVVPIWFRL